MRVLCAIDSLKGRLENTGALSLTSVTVTVTVTSLLRGPSALESLAETWNV